MKYPLSRYAASPKGDDGLCWGSLCCGAALAGAALAGRPADLNAPVSGAVGGIESMTGY